MQGRLLELHSAGPNTNNAFIMCIGEHVVVEFGVRGNACYIFEREGLPFALAGAVAGNRDELKHLRHEERLLHIDSNFDTWEVRFENTISRLTGARPKPLAFEPSPTLTAARPGSHRTGPTSGPMQPAQRVAQTSLFGAPPPEPHNPAEPHSRFEMKALERFCATHRLQVDDRRAQNGCLWVRTHNLDGPVTGQLQIWGFQYKNAHKGWWKQ